MPATADPPDSPLAREVALDLLDAVLGRRRPFDEAADRDAGLAGLDARDRAFARALVLTTLRRLGQIDVLIDGCLVRPLPRKARTARDIMRLGAAQLVFLETPPHAAVDTAVTLVRRRRQGPYAALVNAVLRRLARDGAAMAAAQDAPRLDTPDWLWRSWSAAYGEAACRRIAAAHLGEPPLDLTARDDAEAVADALGGTVLATGSVRLERAGPVAALPGYAEGRWWVQDAAAALPARLLGDVRDRRVLDLCAAPGGKTAQLAAAGARVTAVEQSPARVGRLRENLDRLGLAAEIVVADATTWRPDEPADAVLLDAPCTSTGSIRRHPDVGHLKQPDDVGALAGVQARLLAAAVEATRPGGTIVYCVCSLQPEEGSERIAALLASGAPVERSPITASEVPGAEEAITGDGDLRTLPFHRAPEGGMDGFFAARLRRV